MTLTQLEYAVALEMHGSFVAAAEKRFVTQPTLSMQIQKLEEELGIKLFDRSSQPIRVTPQGKPVLEQAKIVLREAGRISDIIQAEKNNTSGELRLGIIPTIAPYLIPLFIKPIGEKYPELRLEISELTTSVILDKLKSDELDCGLMATPPPDAELAETPVYFEPFVAYVSPSHPLFKKNVVKQEDLEKSDLWMMNEGHCFRSQVLQICREGDTKNENRNFSYEAGSIETLKRLVELNEGYTLLPELSVKDFPMKQMKMVRYFKQPEPMREISLVAGKHFVKYALLGALKEEIQAAVPAKMTENRGKKIPVTDF
jgi:LysR family hydrogen peroxide-inducible transcriptional activator